MSKSSYRELHLQKGADYHELFYSEPHLAMIWRLEQKLLPHIVRQQFPADPPTHLDFACGTGRILGLLSPMTASSTGVDLSASMLQVARDTLTGVEFVEADITRDDQLGNRKVDLITAFRFFPRAEPALRREALMSLRQHLKQDGVLIFNNHRTRGSLLRRVIAIKGRVLSIPPRNRPWGMSSQETYELVEAAGLRVEQEYPLGVLPLNDSHMPLPSGLVEVLESTLSRIGLLAPLAQNLIFVCRHANVDS